MFWRSKKRRKKGWASDEAEATDRIGLVEKIRGNDRLWLVGLLVLVVIGVFAIVNTAREPEKKPVEAPLSGYTGSIDDESHTSFLHDFRLMAARREVQAEARFSSTRTLRITVPGDTSRDEINFLSRAAATALRNRYHLNTVVFIYREESNGEPTLVAETKWDADAADFIVRSR